MGAFKIRGAQNALSHLNRTELERGVATHSSGNHAAAVAQAARTQGVRAFAVMPDSAPVVKKAAVAGYGARIIDCARSLADRERVLRKVLEETGAHFVHPYDDVYVIAGQGTVALELIDEIPSLDMIVVPVGGGGLISGTALSVLGRAPSIEVVGVEPAGADDACRSMAAGRRVDLDNPSSVADGLVTMLSDRTFRIISDHVKELVTVEDAHITNAMRTIWERMKLVIEPSAAVPLAALLSGRLDAAGRRVGIILSGGNVDVDRLPWMNNA